MRDKIAREEISKIKDSVKSSVSELQNIIGGVYDENGKFIDGFGHTRLRQGEDRLKIIEKKLDALAQILKFEWKEESAELTPAHWVKKGK